MIIMKVIWVKRITKYRKGLKKAIKNVVLIYKISYNTKLCWTHHTSSIIKTKKYIIVLLVKFKKIFVFWYQHNGFNQKFGISGIFWQFIFSYSRNYRNLHVVMLENLFSFHLFSFYLDLKITRTKYTSNAYVWQNVIFWLNVWPAYVNGIYNNTRISKYHARQ